MTDSTVPQGYLPYQAEFGEHIDNIRELARREIPYKSTEWWNCYQCYMAGRRDEIHELRVSLNTSSAEVAR